MWHLDWYQSGYSRSQMVKMMDRCDYLFLRSADYTAPVKSFFGRMPNGINEDFDLEVFEKLERSR